MKCGDTVSIIPSTFLVEMGLMGIAGKQGVITAIQPNGCWVELKDGAYKGEKEWFLTYNTIVK